jgi:hypothetical protein
VRLAVALVLTLAACGDSSSQSCTTALAAGRLYEGYCDGLPGFCFHDHETPF